MPHVVTCSACEKQFRVAEQHLGRTGACPACKSRITIHADGVTKQATAPKTKPASKALTVERLRESLDGAIRPVRATLTYRLGLLIATVVILLTPLVYLTLIGATGYGVYYHAINHQGILGAARGRGAILAVIVYAAPLVIGPVLVFFMLKPFFSRPRYEQRSRSLVPDREPLLFEFVYMICEAVKAPRPRRIDIDCQMNASASFRRGFGSMLGNDLVLTIGMPLVAGLSLRQFGGVLAHEFGHFSQGAGMRLSYVLRSVTAWLQRSVYQRDEWDEWLASTAEEMDLRIGWVLWLAVLMVWITRRILWCLMMLSMVVVGYVMRQMEYDADRYEARFAGSDVFEATTTKMARLSVAMQKAYWQLGVSQRDGRLADNLPRLVVNNEAKLESDITSALADQLQNSSTGLFDSHPTDRDRIASARREAAPGVFRLDGPASDLFTDATAQNEATTWEFYRQVLGGSVKKTNLQPVADLTAEQDSQRKAFDSLLRYTQATWRPYLRTGLRRDALVPPNSPKEAVAEAQRLRSLFQDGLADELARTQKLDEWHQKLAKATAFETLHGVGVRINEKETPPELNSKEAAAGVRKKAARRVAILTEQAEQAGELTGDRLATSIGLLCHEALYKRLPKGAALKQRVEALVVALVAIEGQLLTINTLRQKAGVLSILLAALQRYGATELLVDKLVAITREVHPKLSQVREVLMSSDYPFDHAAGKIQLGSYLIATIPPRDEIGEVLSITEVAVDSISETQRRILSELCDILVLVEKAIKLPSLPEPSC